MQKIKIWIRRYFGFSQRETTGFLFLLLITVLGIVTPFLVNQKPISYDASVEQAHLDSLVAELEATVPEPENRNRYPHENSRNEVALKPLHPFNPNEVSEQEWQDMGVSRYAAGNIVKYRNKAGGFTYKEQLKRIYGLPEEVYLKLEPYIQLPPKNANAEPGNKTFDYKNKPEYAARDFKNSRPVSRLQPFDINATDTTQLKRIRGIGSKLSARIIKFRDKLGGFYSEAQLTEVYGLAPEIIDSLHKYSFVAPGYVPAKINLNTATLEELRNHPYVGFNVARVLVNYRTQNGPFQTLDQLKNIKILDDQKIQKLKPYLSL